MPRKPTKNRINMHDIIGQPLGALPGAVDAILCRPEALDEVETESIFRESSFILLRAEEALSAADDAAFCALFKLLSEGFSQSTRSYEKGINTFALHAPLLHTVKAIFQVVVEQGALPLHNAGTAELLQVISSLCDGDVLKESCGELFMQRLIWVLERICADKADAKRHFHIQRATATSLINLVKGSKSNKLRLSSWKVVGECCAASVDVFFQLQCIELLFRVSRQNKHVLQTLEDSLPAVVVEKLAALPNDGTLLARMTTLVEMLNDRNPEVLRYALTQVTAADTLLAESTDAYFTQHYFVIMVTAGNADNVTIPYRLIRSITLGKDGRVIVRLEEFPVKLVALLSHTAGMDIVTLFMTPERLGAFKRSSIRSWIVAALQARKDELRDTKGGDSPGTKRAATTPKKEPPVSLAEESKTDASAAEALKAEVKISMPINPIHQNSTTSAADSLRKKAKLEADGGGRAPCGEHEKATSAHPLVAMIDSIYERTDSQREVQAIFLQLKRLIEARLEARHGEGVVELNRFLSRVQDMVDQARRAAGESRATWQQELEAEISNLERSMSSTQRGVEAGVEHLNEALRDIRSCDQALNERVRCMEIDVQQFLEESREKELQDFSGVRGICDAELQRQEFDLDQRLMSRMNPAASLSKYVRSAS